MNQIVNMIVVVEKELELERQGLRRTRRWIGDASQVTDARWYQAKPGPITETMHTLSEPSPVAQTKPRREARRSILARLLRRPRTPRQPACNEC